MCCIGTVHVHGPSLVSAVPVDALVAGTWLMIKIHIGLLWNFHGNEDFKAAYLSDGAIQNRLQDDTRGPFYYHGLTLIPAWISNHMPCKVWDEITYQFLNFNDCTVEV